MIEIGGIFAFILLIADVWAIVNIFGSSTSTGGKVLWIIAIILLPLLGFIVWLLMGPRSAPRAAA